MHKLAARATKLSRQIYASLPWHYRLAQLILKLAVEPQVAHGNFFYGVFVKAGVKGLPDIGKIPAKDFPGRDKRVDVLVNAIRRVDTNYGKKFGSTIWKVTVSRFGFRVAEEAISWMVEKLSKKPSIIQGHFKVSQAESFVLDGIKKRSLDMIKRHWRKKEKSLTVDTGQQVTQRVVADPGALHELLTLVPRGEVKEMMSRLRGVDKKNPTRGPSFVEMVLDDRTQTEMAEAWGTEIRTVGLWVERNRNRLWNILKEYLPGVAA